MEILVKSGACIAILILGFFWWKTRAIALEQLDGNLQKPYAETPSDFGIEKTDISLETGDGVTLAGWWMPAGGQENPSAPRPTILMIHGKGGTMSHTVRRWGTMFAAANFHMLALDLRGHGHSETDPSGMLSFGDNEVKDVLAGLQWLEGQAHERGIDPDGIFLAGQSMGGQTALLAAIRARGDFIPVGVISDSAFADFKQILHDRAASEGYPKFVAWLIYQQMKWQQEGFDLDRVNAAKGIGGLQTPHLILHCTNDGKVPVNHFETLRRLGNGMMTDRSFLCDCPQNLHHIEGHRLEEYDRFVLTWIEDILQPAQPETSTKETKLAPIRP